MRVLKFRTIDFQQCTAISEQNLGSGFHDARFARAGGPQEQEISDWACGRAQAGAEHLIKVSKRSYGLLLPDNLVTRRILEMAGRRTALSRVLRLRVAPLRCCCHSVTCR